MFSLSSRTVSALALLVGVMHVALALPPPLRFETRQVGSTTTATNNGATGKDFTLTNDLLVSSSKTLNSTSGTSALNAKTATGSTSATTSTKQNRQSQTLGSTSGVSALNAKTATGSTSASTSKKQSGSATAKSVSAKSQQSKQSTLKFYYKSDLAGKATAVASGSASNKQSGTATVTQPTAGQSISCQDTEYWAPTVSNWAEEGVDAKLSSWALNLVSHPPTAIPSGSYPTLLPQIFTGFGNTSQYQAIGIAGQLMSIANSGMDASCNLLDGPNGQCPPITVQQACGKMPRWAYLAWTAIYNMFSIHTAINAVLLDSTAFQLGQAPEILLTFVPQKHQNEALEIILSIFGAIMTIIGVLVPLAGLGAAVTLEMENEALMAATLEGGLAGRLGGLDGKGGATIGEGANDDPDAIVSVPANAPGVNFGGNAPAGSGVNTDPPPPPAPAPGTGTGTTGVLVKPQGPNSKVGNPAFIGNVGWVAPGTMTSMSNSIWQESQAAQNSQAKILLNSQAVVEYLGNQSATLTSYNDALLVNINTSDIQNLLSVLAGGSFIETAWSQAIFETALSADIVSREINSAWQSQSMGIGVYVSYTQLNDPNGTICNATHQGVRSTQVCADTGVYYLNNLNFAWESPSLIAPPGFSSLLEYGIMPWWPVSASATAYRIMNPDGKVVPPNITTTDYSGFATYMSDFASANPYQLLGAIGQTPGTWSFPVCDQGLNSWQLDWSNTGGYNTSSPWYLPVPCSCGYQGSGTQAFYEALGARSIDVEWVSAACQANLQTVEPMLDLTTENIAWNRISGGIPPSQTIDYGQGWTANVPAQMPTPCYMGEEFCPPGKDAGTSDPGSIRGGR